MLLVGLKMKIARHLLWLSGTAFVAGRLTVLGDKHLARLNP